jgi:hypothetical protein
MAVVLAKANGCVLVWESLTRVISVSLPGNFVPQGAGYLECNSLIWYSVKYNIKWLYVVYDALYPLFFYCMSYHI